MIKENELRVGNFVSDGIYNGKITVFNNNKCVIKHKSGINKNNIKDLIPVKLTPELLEKFGFKKYNDSNYWLDLETHYLELIPMNNYFYPVFCQIPEMSGESVQRVSIKRIKYVHQLQNLYFALTGEEFEFNQH